MTKAVVLGGGLAGLLAASVLTRHAETVTVIEPDQLPDAPRPRRGLPHAHHSHLLLGGGALALDDLLPGAIGELVAAGAHRRGMPSGLLVLTPQGWMGRHDTTAFVIACSRDLVDHVVRQRVLPNPAIELIESTTAIGLEGDATSVGGVRVRDSGGDETTIAADLVVDATGRRSATPHWLAALGLPTVEEETVDSGLAYVTRLYAAPTDTVHTFPVVSITPHPGTGRPGQSATLIPIEGNRWIVTLAGTRGGEPSAEGDTAFIEFARNLPHSIIGELLASGRPLGEIRTYRGTTNRRRFYERLPVPRGFVVVGDAAATLNPVYGHGMSVAAFCAQALRSELERGGIASELSRRVQAGVSRAVQGAWAMASGQDRGFPGAVANCEPQPGVARPEYMDRVQRLATTNPELAEPYFAVLTLAQPIDHLFTTPVEQASRHSPQRSPWTSDEAIAQFPELADLRKVAAPAGVDGNPPPCG